MATEKRKAKKITKQEDIDFLLNMDNNITTTFMMECFGEFDGKRRFEPYDEITIPVGKYGKGSKKNKNPIDTTVGIWVFNKYFIEEELIDIFGYINEEVGKKTYGKISSKLSYALMEDEIDTDTLHRFLMKSQKMMPFVSILSPGFSLKMLTVTKVLEKRKKELLKKYEKEIAAGDEKVVGIIEKELLDIAQEYLKDDPAMDIYLSGARGNIGNNFKNLFVMRGAIKDPDPLKGYDIVTSNYMEGISKEDYVKMCKSLVEGPYARAGKTQLGGYWEKLFLSACQYITMDAPDSDCGTKRTIDVYLTDKNVDQWMYSYVVEGSKLTEITSKTKDKFLNKKVKLRFSSLCESKTGICNKCLGNLYRRLGITNIGTTTPMIPSTLKNLSMKLFHDSQVSLVEMDVNKAFGVE